MPLVPEFITLQVPHLAVSIKHQALAALREVSELDPATQLPVRRPATADGVAAGTERVVIHAYVEVLARLLYGEKAGEYRRLAFGGHAAVVVESDVARNAAR
jgi:hypothetical protein